MKDILWFNEIGEGDLDAVGGKGLNLGLMVSEGFPIPPGYAITSKVYFDFIEKTGIKSKLKKLLKNLDVEETEELQSISDEIYDIFLEEEFTDELKSKLMKAFEKLKGNDKLHVAVRSSATAEDLPEASFAGQQETYLGVDEENLIKSVLKCWASLFTARAIYYREKNNFSHIDIGISVIVQKLIDADVAGVLFSKHPSTGKNVVIIEAGLGLGDPVVAGEITPDTYTVDRENWEIVNKEISNQKFKIVRKGNTTEEIDLGKDDGNKQKLPDDKIKKLAKIGVDIENYYDGEAQDIEWASSDQLYVLQSRPVTTIQEKEKVEEKEAEPGGEVILKGLAASPGVGSGEVTKIKDADELSKIKDGDVLVTTMTTPDMVPGMKRSSAILTDEGGMTSHAAIVSRELGIPCIVGTSEATEVLENDETITVDGSEGRIYKGRLESKLKEEEERKEAEKTAQSVIVTGTKIYVNLSSPSTAPEVAKRNVDGVGLFRAEFIAAQIGKHPKKMISEGRDIEWSDELAEGIRKVASAFSPKPVVYRTLDFKTNEYRELPGGQKYEPEENNPMIGFRGCNRNITSREVFELELRAIKKVREKHGLKNLHIMFPFVRTLDGLKKAIEIANENGLKHGKDFLIWMMVEVPSTVLRIDEFLQYVDGVSIGTNDLTQLILGVDRDNQNLAELFDERDPAVLRALEIIIKACRKHDKTVSVCGQAPSVYEEIVEFLVKHGVTSVSVNPDAIESTRKLIARVEHKYMLDKLRELKL
jgi:pyruvate, water dikinase